MYYLALSSFNNDPRSDAGEIFPDLFSTSLYPDMVVPAAGVGADEPIVGWSGPPWPARELPDHRDGHHGLRHGPADRGPPQSR